jgi:hypothetical protein
VSPTARDAEGVLERAEDRVVARHGSILHRVVDPPTWRGRRRRTWRKCHRPGWGAWPAWPSLGVRPMHPIQARAAKAAGADPSSTAYARRPPRHAADRAAEPLTRPYRPGARGRCAPAAEATPGDHRPPADELHLSTVAANHGCGPFSTPPAGANACLRETLLPAVATHQVQNAPARAESALDEGGGHEPLRRWRATSIGVTVAPSSSADAVVRAVAVGVDVGLAAHLHAVAQLVGDVVLGGAAVGHQRPAEVSQLVEVQVLAAVEQLGTAGPA